MVGTKQRTESDEAVLDCLAHERRRSALRCLREYRTPMALSDLADEVACEGEPSDADPSDDRIQRIAVSLHHAHLPKLEDAGVVEYDHRTNMVALSDRLDEFEDARRFVAIP